MTRAPPTRLPRPALALLALAALLHLGWMAVDGWPKVLADEGARDWASYHYAAEAAARGLDPYDKQALARLARAEGTRGAVHPFFYPPPYLLLVAWTPALGLAASYRLWFWLDGLALLVALGALLAWRPRLDTAAVVGGALLLFTPLWNNHLMGQANLPVLALVLWGLLAEERGRPWHGGALVGVACMMKMSPGLIVAAWLGRGRLRPALAACAMAVLLSLATLPLLDLPGQLRFYTDVLPGFSSGEYAGLTVPIDIFANHGLPDLWNAAFPGDGHRLTPRARLGAGLTNLALVVGALLGLRGAWTGDTLARLCAWSALVVVMLMVPVYTYEHHLVWLVLPAVAAVGAAVEGRLSRAWWPALALALALACAPLVPLKRLAAEQGPALAFALGELKFLAAATLGLACYVAARARPAESPG